MGIGYWEYVPVVGDAYDIYHGGKKAFDPNLDWKQRAMGAGQMALGVGGLMTLGGGSLVKGAGKAGLKMAGKAGAKKFMTQKAKEQAIKSGGSRLLTNLKYGIGNMPYNIAKASYEMSRVPGFGAKNFLFNAPFRAAAGVSDFLFGAPDKETGRDISEDEETPNKNLNNNWSGNGGATGAYSSYGSYGNTGLTPEQQSAIVKQLSDSEGNSQYGYGSGDPMQLYSDYMLRQQAMQPYRDELNNYIRDYRRYSDWAYNQDKHLALLAQLTGAQGLNNMIGKYTALGDEEKLAALKKVQGEDYKNIGDQLAQMQGNIALTRKMGLPLESVNASDHMLRLAIQDQMNDDRLENKLALAQYNAAIKQKLQEEKFRFQQAIKAGNRRAAQHSYMKMNELYKAYQIMDEFGINAADIYRSTGKQVTGTPKSAFNNPSIRKL